MFDQIVINQGDLLQYKKDIFQAKKPVVLVPTHRSDLDFFILGTIFLQHGMDPPFVAGDEDYSKLAFVSNLLRSCGGFFIDPKRVTQKSLY